VGKPATKSRTAVTQNLLNGMVHSFSASPIGKRPVDQPFWVTVSEKVLKSFDPKIMKIFFKSRAGLALTKRAYAISTAPYGPWPPIWKKTNLTATTMDGLTVPIIS
jgi:hypothetical protein